MAAAPKLIFNGTKNEPTIVLAHGAGAPMDTPFMDHAAKGLAKQGLRVARFEFPYMAARRGSERKPPPDREPKLRETWLAVIDKLGAEVIIGGKSMGGRIASLVADESGVAGLVCLGYPFHPTGKPDKLRTEHLRAIQTPTLILQGQRDAFGNREEVPAYQLSSAIQIHWMTDGDHSFKPRKASGRTAEQNWDEGVVRIAKFVAAIS